MKNFKTVLFVSLFACSSLITACGQQGIPNQGTNSVFGQGVVTANGCPAGMFMIGSQCTTGSNFSVACSQGNGQIVTNAQNVNLCKVQISGSSMVSVTNTGNSGYLTWGYNGYTSGAGSIYGYTNALIPLVNVNGGDTVSITMIPSQNVTALSCFNAIQYVSGNTLLVTGSALASLPGNAKNVMVQNTGILSAQYTGNQYSVAGIQFSVVTQINRCSNSSGTAYICP